MGQLQKGKRIIVVMAQETLNPLVLAGKQYIDFRDQLDGNALADRICYELEIELASNLRAVKMKQREAELLYQQELERAAQEQREKVKQEQLKREQVEKEKRERARLEAQEREYAEQQERHEKKRLEALEREKIARGSNVQAPLEFVTQSDKDEVKSNKNNKPLLDNLVSLSQTIVGNWSPSDKGSMQIRFFAFLLILIGFLAIAIYQFSQTLNIQGLDALTPVATTREIATVDTATATNQVTTEPTSASFENTPVAQINEASSTPSTSAPISNLDSVRLYRIVSEESEVSFTLTEDLRGVFTTVVGVTDQVAGDILVDVNNPAGSRMGELRINARTLTTDNEFRNRAIRSEILQSSSDAYEFISFTPTALEGLPDSVSVGDAITFTVTGDLKIREITQSVSFEVTATLVSDDRLEGTASATVTRTQYDLQIPSVPGVANVSDEVQLQLRFVANRVEA